jgi:branched-chain amino acid transport system substrate-binding protein
MLTSIKAQPVKNVYAALQTDDAEGFMSAWDKAGMKGAGYKLFGPGPLTDQAVLDQAKSAAVGVVTTHVWSAAIDTPENKTFVDSFFKTYKDDETGEPVLPNAYAVQMWDAMRALDEALKRTGGDARAADALIGALEGVSFKSPRGDFAFDKATHNPVQDVYVLEVKETAGRPVNTVVSRVAHVADPGK